MKHLLFILLTLTSISWISCSDSTSHSKPDLSKERERLTQVMTKHLNAVTAKDASTLRSTLSPDGEMQLILEGMEIIESVDSFMQFHHDWFKVESWTMNSKILNSFAGQNAGYCVVESMYREPERDGKPYFNRLIVSYDLIKKADNNWYIVKDHATSAEKSTDKK